ncbi:dihydroorotate dehydrogenase electron transfer subunit [Fictibacillus terranigra]|uniref:Dihydroorotate dehydrogenase B (NAD(+)), electron transfer subunit n=1 Tax=Fictibacillus terranigra TaxID=3058424 RepID=A0ABT8E6G7_9BACL|nr:dihydroorotate dehydrogenase electron transfer subunit [Fictibacillus sp. CENA-BCM004]MDN4073506.1 dihydroorotate dehydrogenase electron transfer subunit [Fictibacillus sp. CENA-BCM004]
MRKEMVSVVSQKEIARNIFELKVKGDVVSDMTSPGQFVHMRVSDSFQPLLRRPISICDVDLTSQTLTMLYRKEGAGTSLLSEKKDGDMIDLLGPLGNGFPLDALAEGKTALLVGGGIGVPPLYYLAKQLQKRGIKVISVLGFQSFEDAFYKEKFEAVGEVFISTADGSQGCKGFVTDVIKSHSFTYDLLYSCGPSVMLKALEQQVPSASGYFSLEERMGCGIGACFACVCHVNGGLPSDYVKVCSNGPVFPIGEVVL